MNDKDTPVGLSDTPVQDELASVEFHSPGRFAVHNPESVTADTTDWEPAPFPLGSHEQLERFERPQEARAHFLALIQQARRTLCLYSNDLEPWLCNHSSIQEACTRFLLSSPRTHLRILLRDSDRAIRESHALLRLSRRLTSSLHIRKLNPALPPEDQTYLIADDRGLLLRPQLDQPGGYALYNDPVRVRQRQAQFEQAWDNSVSDPNLRSFLL
ncbi:histone acetyltransferase HPA2 [Pseudomonas sp. NCCP-436]|uniref:DUF7931 domain-containing protein n=1 Tax=Pseudomonas sp. NCCP-436 TaxID=2842481 RepID=UPI001C80BAE8|nr:histone acetyltransferase HPA2 [Pseudomonas sp. NCCP-436]GIZ13038.1 hypothetical protein NCCP436_24540 [Pseudomonas sp. NCCP-436]